MNFSLGDIVNNDSDASAEQVIIEFDVLVNNDANNNNTNLKNNNFTVTVNNGSVDISRTSTPVQVTIVEPFLNIAKSANDSTWLYGQSVQYTLDVTHIASASPAYDIVVTDTIPNGLTFNLLIAPTLSCGLDIFLHTIMFIQHLILSLLAVSPHPYPLVSYL